MKLFRTSSGVLLEHDNRYYLLSDENWDAFVNQDHLAAACRERIRTAQAEENISAQVLAPIGSQEVWAAGVTYFRSRTARMEESQDAGGGTFYDRVYAAERPELFFKSTPERVVPTGGKVRIRQDSTWNVPEPELTLFLNRRGEVAGYTIGNDMSSRSIEGENPLYLPQAKVYDGAASLGPCLYVTDEPLSPETSIRLEIRRDGVPAFEGTTQVSQIKRSFAELAEFLFREMSFPNGAYLMTGTGIVPPNEFTLQSGDEIHITIGDIGTLVNEVA
jgi:2-dehydro-3-deoxy-D-arabinonate dehydratase